MVKLFFIRILNRKSPFQKDLKHFHHLLIARYPLHITLILYLMLCFFPFIIINHFALDPLVAVLIQTSIFQERLGRTFHFQKTRKTIIK